MAKQSKSQKNKLQQLRKKNTCTGSPIEAVSSGFKAEDYKNSVADMFFELVPYYLENRLGLQGYTPQASILGVLEIRDLDVLKEKILQIRDRQNLVIIEDTGDGVLGLGYFLNKADEFLVEYPDSFHDALLRMRRGYTNTHLIVLTEFVINGYLMTALVPFSKDSSAKLREISKDESMA